MYFADLHIHALAGVDDGAATRDEMLAMVQAAYLDGARLLCLTPHFHPGYYGNNGASSAEVFESLQAHCRKAFPDLELMLGNELHYSRDCVSWLESGACRTINGTRYVLVDFSDSEQAAAISGGIDRLLNAGYIPILAHAERYKKLRVEDVREMTRNGALIQINVGSLSGEFGLHARYLAKELLAARLVTFVGSDAHGMKRRVPGIGEGYRYIAGKYGEEYAGEICCGNAADMLCCGVPGKD